METKGGKKKFSRIQYEAPLGYIIEEVRPNGGIQKFRSAAYSNVRTLPIFFHSFIYILYIILYFPLKMIMYFFSCFSAMAVCEETILIRLSSQNGLFSRVGFFPFVSQKSFQLLSSSSFLPFGKYILPKKFNGSFAYRFRGL